MCVQRRIGQGGCLSVRVSANWACESQQLPLSNSGSLTEMPLSVCWLPELHPAARQEPVSRGQRGVCLPGDICSSSPGTCVWDRTLLMDAQCCLWNRYEAIQTQLRTARVRLDLPLGFMAILCLNATPAASPWAEQSGKRLIRVTLLHPSVSIFYHLGVCIQKNPYLWVASQGGSNDTSGQSPSQFVK